MHACVHPSAINTDVYIITYIHIYAYTYLQIHILKQIYVGVYAYMHVCKKYFAYNTHLVKEKGKTQIQGGKRRRERGHIGSNLIGTKQVRSYHLG